MKYNLTDSIKISLFFILIGIVFAVETFFDVRIVHKLWPLITVVLGSGLVNIFFLRRKRDVIFFSAGSYLVMFSLLAFYLNFTSWTYLADLWPLFIAFAGMSFLFVFGLKSSSRLYLLLGLFLISFSIAFFIMLSVSTKYWWTIFFLSGLSILAAGRTDAR